MVSAFGADGSGRRWTAETQGEDDRSSNLGGGLAVQGGTVFATTGRAEALALDAGTGKITWRAPLDAPARSAPTIAEGRLFVPMLDERLVALATADGKRLWNYQSTAAATVVKWPYRPSCVGLL